MSGRQECRSGLDTTPTIRTWAGFLLMCLGMFMAILDVQVVATSLPTIQLELAISPDAMSWIQTAYLIAEVIAIPLTGLFTRVLTLRGLFAVAVASFTLASVGCAFSGTLAELLACRVAQGFSGGVLIPAVFSAVFLLFPARLHAVATTIGGVVAVMAPTVGPVVGGWITDNWSWPFLFLINVIPGLIAAFVTPLLLPRQKTNFSELATLDGLSLVLLAAALAALMIGLKEAPQRGWLSLTCVCLLLGSAAGIAWFVRRSLRSEHPVVQLATLRRRSFAIGCGLSFCLGVGLFGSVYLMPVFLAFVRRHDAFEIGTIMLVTGVAQLIAAPVAALLESRGRLCPVCGRAWPKCHSAAHRRFRRNVVAANPARHRHHVLPAAADPHRARRAAAVRSRGCQRTVQPDAQSRRRHRHRADRHHPVWPKRHLCRGFSRSPAGR
jgi:DHA2 family multidrug resistance protein